MLAPPVCLIVLCAPLVGLLATMVLTATELAAEISAIRIPRVGQKANSTMAAVDRTACQIATTAQDGIQRQLILTNKRTGAVVLMPVLAKCREFRDRYDKNARFSVKMLSVLCMSSSYRLDAHASRCRARIFCRSAQKTADLRSRNEYICQHLSCFAHLRRSQRFAASHKLLLGNKEQELPGSKKGPAIHLPSSGPL